MRMTRLETGIGDLGIPYTILGGISEEEKSSEN
jgi:hypothetical protein